MSRFLSLAPLLNRRNFVLIDTPAEDSECLAPLIEGAEHVLAVVTPEQVASAEALAFIMNLHRIAGGKHIYVILNRAPSSEVSDLICNRLEHDIGRILGVPMTCLGYVPDEPLMASAAESRWPFVVMAPESETSSCLAHVAGAITEICGTHRQNEGSERFLGDLFGCLQNDRPLSLAIRGSTKRQRELSSGITERGRTFSADYPGGPGSQESGFSRFRNYVPACARSGGNFEESQSRGGGFSFSHRVTAPSLDLAVRPGTVISF